MAVPSNGRIDLIKGVQYRKSNGLVEATGSNGLNGSNGSNGLNEAIRNKKDLIIITVL